MEKPSSSFELWKKLGLVFANWADSTFLYGVGKLGVDIYKTIFSMSEQKQSPLDWSCPVHELYSEQDSVLWVIGPNGRQVFLPQVLLMYCHEDNDESSIRIELEPEDFCAPISIPEALEFYRGGLNSDDQKFFFNGENARLLDWKSETKTLVFQGCSYFDYLQTNLALDISLPVIGSLRRFTSVNKRLEPLSTSKLANSTGLNGLIFSNDGYMIIQKRNERVLIRPGEVCSGFSGTIDKIDIVNAVRSGGHLADLDVLREMVEELGIQRKEVVQRRFLGITRELIRGGAPELFYALDIGLPEKEIRSRIPKDKEGKVKSIFLGFFASAKPTEMASKNLPQYFWHIIENVRDRSEGPISIPLLTNLVLWYMSFCPNQTGVGTIPPHLDNDSSVSY